MITQKIQNRIRTTWMEPRPVKATHVIGIGLPKNRNYDARILLPAIRLQASHVRNGSLPGQPFPHLR
jgi:hypothetical protein